MVTNKLKSAKAQNGKHTNHAATEEHIESQCSNTFNYTTKTYREIENAMMHVQTHTLQKNLCETTRTHKNKKPHHMKTTAQCRHQTTPGTHDLDFCGSGSDATLKPAHSKWTVQNPMFR